MNDNMSRVEGILLGDSTVTPLSRVEVLLINLLGNIIGEQEVRSIVSEAIAEVIDSSADAFDILNDLEDWLETHEEAFTSITESIASSYDSTHVYSEGDYCTHNYKLYKCIYTMSQAESWTDAHWSQVNVVEELKNSITSDSVAPEFSTSASYTAGQYVYKNGVLYRFTQSHSGAWTGTDAETVTVGNELTDLKADLNNYPYGIEPFQLSLFEDTQNLFSNFCYHVEKKYYRSRLETSPEGRARTTSANSWQGWLIRVKPNTTYALGPLDFKLELLDSKFNLDISITEFSSEEPNIITTGPNSLWMCLTQRINRDMSDWMMVEGDTYPSSYISGFPKWRDTPQFPADQLNHITYLYHAYRIKVTYNRDGSISVLIPGNSRIVTQKGIISTSQEDTTITSSSAQFICYDATDGIWTYGGAKAGHERYYIGYIQPMYKHCFFTTNYVEVYNKTVAFMGDSITAGVATQKCYHQYIHDVFGYTCLNYGYGGSGWYRTFSGTDSGKIGMGTPGMGTPTSAENAFTPNNILARLQEIDETTTDCVVIFAGTNDWGHGVAINDFTSAIDSAFEYCKTNLTDIPILVLTPIHRRYDTILNSQGKTLREYADIIIEECKKYSIAYIDTMTVSELYPDNAANRLLYFANNQDSGLHPSSAGHKKIATCVGETIKQLITYSDLDTP